MIAPTIALLVAGLSLAQPATAQEADHPASSVDEERRESAEDAATVAVASQRVLAPTQQIDVRIYGGTPLTPQSKDPATAHPYTPPKAVPASATVQGSLSLAEGAAAMTAANREKATTLSSAAAGASLLASNLNPSRGPDFAQDPEFDSAEFMRKVVDFTLDLSDEKFMLEAQSEEEARYRMEILRDQHRTAAVWGQNSRLINSIVGALSLLALTLWWWLSQSSRTKTLVTRWAVRAVILFGSFYLHWAFGLFMLIGLYTHVSRSHGRV